MAEFVHSRTEDMIPELEQMECANMFDKTEIRGIVKKRKDFEYKIQRRAKCKEDYLRYIQFEMDLLKGVKTRRENMGLGNKKDIEFAIANRVNRLFSKAIKRFPSDVRIWISYIKFCKQMRFFSVVGRTLAQMMQVHSDKPNLWSFAAKWEFEENHSVENARQFLLRGLRFHPESKVLYSEAFRLELQYAARKRKQHNKKVEGGDENATGEDNNTGMDIDAQGTSGQSDTQQQTGNDIQDKVLDCRLAEVIYESAMKKINDANFLISLLSIAKQYNFTHRLQTKMVNYLLTTYSNDEMTWDTMARRELEGLSYADLDASGENGVGAASLGSGEEKAITLKERIRMCVGVYVAVAKQLPTEKMWSLYLEFLLELNQDQSSLPVFKQKLLRVAFETAHAAGCMQEKYYLLWVEMLKSQGKLKKLQGVLRTATARIPSSVELWQVRLCFYLSKDNEKKALDVFKDATTKLGNSEKAALHLWKMMLHYYQTKDIHKVEQLFKDGIVQGPEISMPLKPMYIEWLALAKGIAAARKVYDQLSIQPPLCLGLHTKMASLESIQPDVMLKYVRKCHEMACDQFGKTNTEVWMEYVKFEQKKGDAQKVTDIYMRAVKNLDPEFTDTFISEFSLVKTGMTMLQEQP
ncbi:U3 small nucleolar RNA-associated protein 6 homolog [Periplaneta americana]|uniref:U3 small nucleolar RNA-associated protein 6 homolog n=1 Tax=Periplaneta americana TaxID=6978 RepID=UPI0037E720D8